MGLGKRCWEEDRAAQLERKIGHPALEIEFFEGVLRAHRGAAEVAGLLWITLVYEQDPRERDEDPGLTVERMRELAGVRWAGLYRSRPELPTLNPDMALRDAIQRIAPELPSCGWRHMTRELRRRGWVGNHKRVYRWMREDNLLCLRKRKFVLTIDSDHGLPVYPILARELTLTGLDQLGGADLIYIRLELEFVYLAMILDAFPRRVIGWVLGRLLEATLVLEALRMALRRRPLPELVRHLDRGMKYARRDYTQLLQEHGIQISPSRKGNPWDDAARDSFTKTLEYEEVYRTECFSERRCGRLWSSPGSSARL